MASTPTPRTELYLDAHRNPVQNVFGWHEGTGTHATNKCLLGTFTGTTPLNVTGLTKGGLYEFEFMDAADLLGGSTDKWYFYKPGGTAAAPAASGTSMPWDTTNGFPLRVRLGADQDTISFVAANTAKTVRVYAIQLE
jgi:hypothetical protein